jgi:hypothetical protein
MAVREHRVRTMSHDARLLRAPQEKANLWGRLSLVTFFGEAKKVTAPAA